MKWLMILFVIVAIGCHHSEKNVKMMPLSEFDFLKNKSLHDRYAPHAKLGKELLLVVGDFGDSSMPAAFKDLDEDPAFQPVASHYFVLYVSATQKHADGILEILNYPQLPAICLVGPDGKFRGLMSKMSDGSPLEPAGVIQFLVDRTTKK